MTCLSAALKYAAMGWHVFPVQPLIEADPEADGKSPYPGTHGHLDATAVPKELEELFAGKDRCNIGLACSDSGLVVVDVDIDLDTEEGRAWFESFKSVYELPDTYTQMTPGGGVHLFYFAREGAAYMGQLPNIPGASVSAGEVKHNGYILLPPSTAKSKRRSDPGQYEVIHDRPVIEAPEWLERAFSGPEPMPELDPVELSKLRSSLEDAVKMMRNKRNRLSGYEQFRDLAFALKNAALLANRVAEVRDEFEKFALRWELRKETDLRLERGLQKTYDWATYRPGGKQIGTAFWILKEMPDLGPSDIEPVILKQQTTPKLDEIRLTGLAGRIAEVMREASDRESKVFPEAAALMAMSALAAPRYILRGPQGKVALNLYGLLLGGTGSGKESARKATDMVLKAASRGSERLDGAASDRALHRALSDTRGSLTVVIDEGGLQLSAIKKRSSIASASASHPCDVGMGVGTR